MNKKEHNTVVEITDTHVKILQVKPQLGGARLTFGDIRTIEQFTDEHVADLVSQVMKGRDIDPDKFAVVIPRRFVILKQIRLPSHAEEEIHRMAGLQLGSHTPYSREDVIFNQIILEKESGGYSRVLLVVLHKDVVNRYLKVFQKTKLSPHHLVFSSLGVVENYISQSQGHKAKTDKPVVLINIDTISSEICFCLGAKLLFSRQIHFGGRDLNPEGLQPYLEQVTLTLGSYKKERLGPDWGKVVLMTDVLSASLLKERLQEYYSLPVEVMNPLENFPAAKGADPLFLKSFSGVSIASAAGFLLADLGQQMNLMPEDVQLSKKTRLARRAWIRMGIMAAAIFILGVAAFETSLYQDRRYLRKLEQRLTELKPEVSQAEKRIQFLSVARENLSRRVMIADVIRALYQLAPEEMMFTSLSLDSKGSFTILGAVSSGISVNSFQAELLKSDLFKDPTLEYATKRKRIDGEYTEFKIVCQLAAQKEGRR